MRHRVFGRHLNRTSSHRTAMFRNLAAALFEHGEIQTTLPKAKAVQPFVERIITIARRGDFAARRRIESMVNDRRIHSWVADPNVSELKKDNEYFELPDESEIEFNRYGELRKAPRLVQHIMTTIAPMFEDRDGGYTRIIKLGKHRLGDGADLVLLQLVGLEDGPEISGGRSRRRAQADNRTEFWARLRKAGAGEDEASGSDTDTAVATEPATEDAGDDAAEETEAEGAAETDASQEDPSAEEPSAEDDDEKTS